MKKSILLIFLSFILVISNFAQPDWENPYVTGINKEPGHASMGLYSSVEKAEKDSRLRQRADMASDEEKPDRIQSLNDTWKFRWSKNPDERPVEFYKSDFSVNNWDNIVVPGNWQTQGFGKPIYTNFTY